MNTTAEHLVPVEGWRHSWGAAALPRPHADARRRLASLRPAPVPGRAPMSLRGAEPRSAPVGEAFTVRDFIVPVHLRLAETLAQAAIVRDVAAFGAVILFGTMLALVLGGDPML